MKKELGRKKLIRFDSTGLPSMHAPRRRKHCANCDITSVLLSVGRSVGNRGRLLSYVVPLSGMSSIFHGNCRNLSQHRVSPSGNVERESNHGVTLRSAAAAPSASARRYHPPHPRPSAILRPSPPARDAPDEILRSDAGCLNGGTDKTASGQPYSPRRTDDAQSQTEGDAEVGIAVRRHVGEDLAPPGVAVL